jgi:hypothetical protein
MNQAVSTVLIPLLLVSQSLCSVPHSHAGTSVSEPDGHAARPHVHLHHADHDDHHNDGHESDSKPEEQLPDHDSDHDSDAVYAGDIQLLNDVKLAKVAKAEVSALCLLGDEPSTTVVSQLCTRQHPPPIPHSQCALFLQLLSIRC